MSLKAVGVVGDQSTPVEVDIKAPHPLPPGTYIYIRFKARDAAKESEVVREAVGIVGSSMYRAVLPVTMGPEAGMFESYLSDLKKESYMRALLIADITGGKAEAPRHPPPPETPVYLASSEHLRVVYSYDASTSIRIGSLVGFEELEVRVNVNAMPKHILVAGTTGSGKSNLVAVIADRVAQMGGSVVVFDVHGEYRGLSPESSDVDVKVYEASINVLKTPVNLLVNFVIPEHSATKQRRILRNALKKLNDDIVSNVRGSRIPVKEAVRRLYASRQKELTKTGKESEPVEAYRELLKSYLSGDEKAVEDVKDKIDDFFEWYRVDLETPDVGEVVGNRRVVVVDVSTFRDEEKDYMLKVVAENLLWFLKERKIPPTLLVVEEAHLFLSANKSTWSKEALQRFIREGRKFGGMLAIVSQRPRALDTGVVSQVQNFAFLRLVQRADRSVVMDITDVLSEEYANILPTLPPGHGVLIGEWVGWYPVYVKVDLHRGKRVGTTPDVVGVWRSALEGEERKLRDRESLAKEWEGE